jgi:hypothetical protein
MNEGTPLGVKSTISHRLHCCKGPNRGLYLFTDVLGQPIRTIFKGQESTKRRQGINHYSLRKNPEERQFSSTSCRKPEIKQVTKKSGKQSDEFRISECLIVMFAGLNSGVAVFYYIHWERTDVRTCCVHTSGHALYQ